MAFINASPCSSTPGFEKPGSFYMVLLTMVAALEGLLFGFDTAVNGEAPFLL